jgi:hypothetical protein
MSEREDERNSPEQRSWRDYSKYPDWAWNDATLFMVLGKKE